MGPETLLRDRSEEKALAAPRRKPADIAPEGSVNLNEDTTRPRAGLPPSETARLPSAILEEGADAEAGGTLRILFDERPPSGKSRTPLRASLEALGELRAGAGVADWFETASILKSDVVRLRNTNYSRHAAVLLALADALSFTEPDEVAPAEEAKPLFSHALGLLSEPYISEASEEEFLAGLLMAGWNLTPSEEQALELVD